MQIVVADYDPQWPVLFDHLRTRIWPAIADLTVAIEHVGSTSVAGLAAKPVIDMTIVVADHHRLTQVIERLDRIGYRHRGDLGVTGREAFSAPPATPDHHLYACIQGCVALRNHLTVRDRLRRDPLTAIAYGQLKKDLAERFANDIDAYIDGKTAFILSMLEADGFNGQELGEIETINSPPNE